MHNLAMLRITAASGHFSHCMKLLNGCAANDSSHPIYRRRRRRTWARVMCVVSCQMLTDVEQYALE